MAGNILYHYCSTEAFCSIIENRSIRLSALTLSNDTMEGRLIQSIFRDFAMDISGGSGNLTGLQKYMADTSESMWAGMYGLGFCLSEARDMLSQWRGYANNAAGMCIGFSKTYLERLAKESTINGLSYLLVQVEYDSAKQIAILKPLFDILQEIYREGDVDVKKRSPYHNVFPNKPGDFRFEDLVSNKDYSNYDREEDERAFEDAREKEERAFENRDGNTLREMCNHIFRLKHSAFDEEREWRFITQSSTLSECEFRGANDRLVPFRTVILTDFDERGAIQEVITGPRNITPPDMLTALLKSRNFQGVTISKSRVTYRV